MTKQFTTFPQMILTFDEYLQDADCPELVDAFNMTPIDYIEEEDAYGDEV